MGSEQRGHFRIAEQHVSHFIAAARLQLRTEFQRGDLLQRAGDAGRLPRELHRRGVRQRFARARHGGLDDFPEEQPDVADHEYRQPHQRYLSAVAAAAAAARIHQKTADDAQRENAEQQADQADVQVHVAVQHVAEFVRDHALQLVAVEFVQAALRHAHRGVGRRVARGEGVDAGLVLHHPDFRHRHARGDRHFLDHVAQFFPLRVGGVRGYRRSIHTARHRAAATAQGGDAEERAQSDQHHERDRNAEQRLRPRTDQEDRADQIDRSDDRRHRQREQQHQGAGAAPHARLLCEEVHMREL